jgi:hypothetical protein
MKKLLHLLLVFLVITLVYLSPLQRLSSAYSHSVNQYITADTEIILPSSLLLTDKSNHTDFPEMPSFIFILLLCLVVQTKVKPHIYSFIPLIKHLYFLHPIKYQSRYLSSSPLTFKK